MNNKLRSHKVRVYRSSNPLLAEKIRPNDPCPCGSGKKAKKVLRHENEVLRTKTE